MTARAALLALPVALLLAAPAGAADLGACSGPQPNPPATPHFVMENQPLPQLLGISCFPSSDTVAATPIDWGDGTTSPATVSYLPEYGSFQQVWVGAPKSWARATCRTASPSCTGGYRIATTATDQQTGQAYALSALVDVTPAPNAVAPGRIRARARRRWHGTLATVTPGGERHPGELSARIAWGDGKSSAATLTPAGTGYAVSASHRWRKPRRYRVAVVIGDSFAGRTDSAQLTARVSR